MNRKSQGRHVSLADIMIVYRAVFGVEHPKDMPFAVSAEQIKAARPKSWERLVDASMALRAASPGCGAYAMLGERLADQEATRRARKGLTPLPYAPVPKG